MVKSKVNVKSAAGYDSFDFEKEIAYDLAELQHGEEKNGFKDLTCVAIHPGLLVIAQAVKAYKVNGEPLPDNLTRIKAQNTIKEVPKENTAKRKNEGIIH